MLILIREGASCYLDHAHKDFGNVTCVNMTHHLHKLWSVRSDMCESLEFALPL